MRLFLSSFFLCLFFFYTPAFGEEIYKKYTVKVSGIKIGELEWYVKINSTNYTNKLILKSKGMLSKVYRFKGNYFSKGTVNKNQLNPTEYNHLWETSKKTKTVNLIFHNERLISLTQTPVEKEHLRTNIFTTNESKDPLTSFLQIIMGKKNSLVIDGRRMYLMSAVLDKKNSQTLVEISKLSNLWADHKRTKFEKIIFEKEIGDFLPIKINIYFDGRVFKIE